MTPLPDHYPMALAPDATLLEWAHREDTPFAAMRIATGWLKHDDEIRSYLDGVVQGNIHRWRYGYLFDGPTQ